MKNYIIIDQDITDRFVIWNDDFYMRTSDNFGDIYIPIEDQDMQKGWTACIIDDKDVAFSSIKKFY